MAAVSPHGLSVTSTIRLSDGIEIPRLGIGTYLNKGIKCTQTINWSLESGYRLIDTASFYQNETELGAAVRKSDIPRDQLFIVTKLWDDSHGRKAATKAFISSLHRLGLDYVDLYLIHSPHCGKVVESWESLIELKSKGLIRSIGVSNFGIQHIEALHKSFPNELPSVNQLELSPYLLRSELVSYCRKLGVELMAYSPLTQGHMLGDPPLTELASKYSKSTAQLLIRWGLQSGFIVIPKSSKENRIRENVNVFDFEITPEDMKKLNALDRYAVYAWDPIVEPWIS